MQKNDINSYIISLLEDVGCKGIVDCGDSITSQCPFHWNSKNFKTFRISTVLRTNKKTGEQGLFYHCFSCGVGGELTKLVMHLTGLSYKKARKYLNKKTKLYNITVEKLNQDLMVNDFSYDPQNFEIITPDMATYKEPMVEYLKKRKKMYHNILNVKHIIKKYGLYYCDSGWYKNRIIMPVRSLDGQIMYYNDRYCGDTKLKSLHLKESNATHYLHGIYEAITDTIGILCEGAFDMFAVDSVLKRKKLQHKYSVVNCMGTIMSEQRIELLVKKFDKVLVLFDNDKAGRDGAVRAVNKLREFISAENITTMIPKRKDPAKCTATELLEAIQYKKEKKFRLESLLSNYDRRTVS